MNTPTPTSAGPSPTPAGPPAPATWTVNHRWRERWARLEPIEWFDLGHDPRASEVKANPNRRVWRVELGDGVFYVKEFLAAGLPDRVRVLLRGSPAELEWKTGLRAEAAGVRCVGFVALGTRRGGLAKLHSVLITEEVGGAVPLPEAWRETARQEDQAARRRRGLLADAVAKLLADAHRARFLHRDGHSANILVRSVSSSSFEGVYADVFGATTGAEIGDVQAAGAIAQLNQWFGRHASRAERLRFLRRYLQGRLGVEQVPRERLRRWASAITDATRRDAAELYGSRRRRLRRGGKYFASIKLPGGWRVLATLRYRNRDEFPRPLHPDRTVQQWRDWLDELLPAIVAQGDFPDGVRSLAFRSRGLLEAVKWRLSGSPARREFAAGHGLRHRNLPAVWPLAALERKTGILVREAVLLIELRPAAVSLAELLDDTSADTASLSEEGQRRAQFESTGRLLADVSSCGVYWAKPSPSALCFDRLPDKSDRLRPLIGGFGHIFFGTGSEPAGDHAVHHLLRQLRAVPAVRCPECRALAEAYCRRLGQPFRLEDWPECDEGRFGEEAQS